MPEAFLTPITTTHPNSNTRPQDITQNVERRITQVAQSLPAEKPGTVCFPWRRASMMAVSVPARSAVPPAASPAAGFAVPAVAFAPPFPASTFPAAASPAVPFAAPFPASTFPAAPPPAAAAATGRKMPVLSQSQYSYWIRFTIRLTPLALRSDGFIQVESNFILLGFELEFAKGFFDDKGASICAELSDFCLGEILACECCT